MRKIVINKESKNLAGIVGLKEDRVHELNAKFNQKLTEFVVENSREPELVDAMEMMVDIVETEEELAIAFYLLGSD